MSDANKGKKDLGDLVTYDTITTEAEFGECKVELCFGSVTALKAKEKVDALVTSAFNGCYAPTSGSVIGALFRDLDISVTKLSKDKEEDLRQTLSCWWSKVLPKKLPYKRILCFEGNFKKGCKPPSTISEVFRSLVSLAQNKDMTVMMPLLASGAQAYSEKMMLRLIVDTAINWMLTGLPLRLLKIVVYTQKHSPDARIEEISKQFNTIKENWIAKWKEERIQKSIVYDVYLSYSPADKPYVEMITTLMKQENEMLRIHDEHQEVDTESSWQEQIFDVIITCSRVIALLSPDYIQEAACIEQFNIAMCCSRKKNILVPFYVKEIVHMPTYIGLIQYLDCRSLETNLVTNACVTVITSISSQHNAITTTQTKAKEGKKVTASSSNKNKDKYDIFVSYCHQDMEVAVKVVDMIKSNMPKCKIFFDQNDLKVGTTWQYKLYNSIENSRFMVALLSESYLNSKVCQEEYNLAHAMHTDPQYPITLYDIKLSSVSTWPTWCNCSHMFDISVEGSDFDALVSELIKRLKNELKKKEKKVRSATPIKETTEAFRAEATINRFPIITGTNFTDNETLREVGDAYQSKHTYDVIISHHCCDERYSKILAQNLLMLFPNIKISLPDENAGLRLHQFDRCKLIVPLLSRDYVTSPEHMEELHTALCRHRFSNEIILFPIVVDKLPPTPVHPHLLFTLFNVNDEVWHNGTRPTFSCLNTAAIVIGNILNSKPRVLTSFRTLLSIRELVEWTEIMTSSKTDNSSDHNESLQLPLCYFSKTIANHTVEASPSSPVPLLDNEETLPLQDKKEFDNGKNASEKSELEINEIAATYPTSDSIDNTISDVDTDMNIDVSGGSVVQLKLAEGMDDDQTEQLLADVNNIDIGSEQAIRLEEAVGLVELDNSLMMDMESAEKQETLLKAIENRVNAHAQISRGCDDLSAAPKLRRAHMKSGLCVIL